MPRRLALILATISLVFLPLFFAPKILAEWKVGDPIENMDQLDATMNQSGLDKSLKEFCAKRQGNQMNLETWYSGKCPKEDETFDTFSGEGVGFSDIVILDLAEKLIGKSDPNKTFSGTLQEVFNLLGQLQPNATPQQQQIALGSAREKLFSNQNSGLVGQTGKMIGMLFQNQPASTGSYLAYISQNLQKHKVIPQALAATGVGFTTFSPFLTIWMVFRNLAYLGLVVFFIIYGFMMMFRVNLGQKTVISVQLAIPKLIITLLIITFSYAIVGLIYDLMWVVITFIFGYLESQKLIFLWPIVNASPATLASGNTIFGTMGSLVINSLVAGPAAIFGVLNLILGGVGSFIGTIVGFYFGINWIISLIIIIAVLISYGKLFIKLISAFISVVISLVTAPLVLLGNAFPGSQVIGTWIRGIVANLSVFPITMLLLLFSYILMIQPILGICVSTLGVAGNFIDSILTPLLSKFGIVGTSLASSCEVVFGVKSLVANGNSGIYGIPLISTGLGANAQGLLALLGVGLLLMASKYVDIVRDALKVPPFKYGTDIANALKGGLKYAPAAPGGQRIADSQAYQAVTEIAGTKPTNMRFPSKQKPTGSVNTSGGTTQRLDDETIQE